MSLKFFLLFLSFVGLNAHSANRSSLYSSNGKLKANPRYSIDSTRVKDVSLFESYELPFIYNKVKYPGIALECAISGMVIAKIRIDSTGHEVEIVESDPYPPNSPPVNNFFNESVKNGINACKNGLLRFVESNEIRLPFEFYIPFQFVWENTYREGLKNKNAVVIKERASADGVVKIR